jgi:hypothetical protein
MIATLHVLVALLVAVSGALVTLTVVAGAALHREARFAIDRAILAGQALVVVGIVLGLVILVTGGRPADPLHLLYAAVALIVLPFARFWHRLAGRRALAVGAGGIVLAALVLRLFQTG